MDADQQEEPGGREALLPLHHGGTEHLGDYIVRFHFAGRVVRDVDLRAVLSTEELAGLTAGLTSIGDIRVTVMWPSGLHISPDMLDLIYAGSGERKGWPKTVPPVDPTRRSRCLLWRTSG